MTARSTIPRLAATLATLLPFLLILEQEEASPAPRAAAAPTTALPSRLGMDDTQGEGAVWWARTRPMSSATLWLSPMLLASNGLPVRWWVATCSIPGSPEPLSCLQGSVPADSRDPIRFHGGIFQIDFAPGENRTWQDVRRKQELDARVVGLE